MIAACHACVSLGVLMLLLSLYPCRRIIRVLPRGRARGAWWVLMILIVGFIVGYLAFNLLAVHKVAGVSDMVVPLIFMFGGVFVLLVTSSSLDAVKVAGRVQQLEIENTIDPLMGIHNRRFFDARLVEETARAHRYGLPLSLLLLDIDHFKRVNDTHGHQGGDAVIAALGRLLSRQVRLTDVAARIGGEEVAIIATNTPLEGARTLAERIRTAAQQLTIDGVGAASPARIDFTVSIGVAALAEGASAPEGLVAAADRALYRAKDGGRNRVEYAG